MEINMADYDGRRMIMGYKKFLHVSFVWNKTSSFVLQKITSFSSNAKGKKQIRLTLADFKNRAHVCRGYRMCTWPIGWSCYDCQR